MAAIVGLGTDNGVAADRRSGDAMRNVGYSIISPAVASEVEAGLIALNATRGA